MGAEDRPDCVVEAFDPGFARDVMPRVPHESAT
eukprot:CAMPEP_0179075356 /NCGR_PEP_ID=MMETSP0796-20121207/33552_1 /TAXON_ID=73915 /ORGANISM="Pyrodinium bahamense, Strain pbaha01" /LENGTH=32 /DNA_ID= /DNA_START= /DNA_END= /DNA_ORIENTATION=